MKWLQIATTFSALCASSFANNENNLPQTTFDILEKEETASIFFAAISEYPSLVDQLTSLSPDNDDLSCTVFIPTDIALGDLVLGGEEFDASAVSMYTPNNMWRIHLLDLISNHIVPHHCEVLLTSSSNEEETVMSSLTRGEPIKTHFQTEDENEVVAFVNDFEIIEKNKKAQNGVVHLINGVLLPFSATKNIVEIVAMQPQSSPQFSLSIFQRLIEASDLLSTLSGSNYNNGGPFTLLAPSDAAFQKLGSDFIDNLLQPQHKQTLEAILSYHLIPEIILSSQDFLSREMEMKTISNCPLLVRLDADTIQIKGSAFASSASNIVSSDILAKNGIIHILDNVLIAPEGSQCHTFPPTMTRTRSFFF